MSWLKVDDHFPENEKVENLHDRAFRFHVTAMCYCARNLTDGIVSPRGVKVVGAIMSTHPRRWVNELVNAGLWISRGGGEFEIKDYLIYNPTKEQVKEDRRKARERMKNVRDSRRTSPEGSAERSPSPSRPVPKEHSPQPPRGGQQGAIGKKELRRYTGCRQVYNGRAPHWVRDPLGTDKPPQSWPHDKPTAAEVTAALEERNAA